jgi:hypothetical protein
MLFMCQLFMGISGEVRFLASHKVGAVLGRYKPNLNTSEQILITELQY